MKIENKTHYQTNDLKKLFTACIKRNDKDEGKIYRYRKNLKIEVVNSRYGYFTGHAWYGGPMRLRIPKTIKSEFAVMQMAWLFTHEFLHVRSYSHKKMAKNDMRFHPEDWEWAKKYQVRAKELKSKPKRDLRMERYGHAVEMLKKYERQMKRTENLLKKWRDKKAYYEKDTELLRRMIQS